ncbi:MAG: hypothetical protein J6V53_05645 [Alphaproteobacteria bacterium]|nr:hypothetical protein [Alphaproteobacteria bacterium]
MGEPTITQPEPNASAALAQNATPATPAVTPEQAPQVQAPQLQPVTGPKGETTITLPGGIVAQVKGYDPASGHFILTCADTPENRAPYPGAEHNHKRVLQTRNSNPTIANAVQYYRNENNELTISIPSKSGSWQDLQKASTSAKSAVGQMHIVDKTKTNDNEKNQAQAEKEKEEKAWYDPTGWKFWAILAATLGVATLGYFAFRKGGWLRPDDPGVVPPTPNPEPDPEKPDPEEPEPEEIPEWEDEHTKGTDVSADKGSSTTVIGNATDNPVSVPEDSMTSDNANAPTFGQSQGRFR